MALGNLFFADDKRCNISACNKHLEFSMYNMDLDSGAHPQSVIRCVKHVTNT